MTRASEETGGTEHPRSLQKDWTLLYMFVLLLFKGIFFHIYVRPKGGNKGFAVISKNGAVKLISIKRKTSTLQKLFRKKKIAKKASSCSRFWIQDQPKMLE